MLDQAESALYDLQQELKQNGTQILFLWLGMFGIKTDAIHFFRNSNLILFFMPRPTNMCPLMEYNPYRGH